MSHQISNPAHDSDVCGCGTDAEWCHLNPTASELASRPNEYEWRDGYWHLRTDATPAAEDRAALVTRLAGEFSRRLLITMRETNLGLVRLRNSRQKNPSICHTHDFCDANVVMAEAFQAVTGREFDIENHEDSALWHEAWDEAKAGGFVS